MAKSQKKNSTKGCKKAGRNKAKCERYRLEHRRYKNKLRRVRHSNGEATAELYRKNYLSR